MGSQLLVILRYVLLLNISIQLNFTSVPGGKWLRPFVKRHKSEIKWKKEEKLEEIRAKKFTEETRKSCFSLLQFVLTKLDLHDKPSQIFNCDENRFFRQKLVVSWLKIYQCYLSTHFRKTRHFHVKYATCIRKKWWQW